MMSGIFAKRMDRTVWRAGWREIGGINKFYRSRWEANYARYLEFLKNQGQIQGWAHEPTTFWFEGIKRGVNNYLPDFRVYLPGEGGVGTAEEYHEVKGYMDTKSATKIKRMGIYFPNIKLVIIDRPQYVKLEREFAKVIDGWELLEKPKETPGEETPKPKKVRQPSKKKQQEMEKQLEL